MCTEDLVVAILLGCILASYSLTKPQIQPDHNTVISTTYHDPPLCGVYVLTCTNKR